MTKEGIGIIITFNGLEEIFVKGDEDRAKEYYQLYEDIKPLLMELDRKVVEIIKCIKHIKQNIDITAEELIIPPDEKYW